MKSKIINIIYSFIILLVTIIIFYFSINSKEIFIETLSFLYKKIIPSLFPFMIFVNFILLSNCIDYLSILLKPFGKFFHLSGYSMTIIIASLLGGYPYSAIIVSSFLKDNKINEIEAKRIMISMFFPSISFLFFSLYSIDHFFILNIISLYISSFLLLYFSYYFYEKPKVDKKIIININNDFSSTYFNVMKSSFKSIFSISFSIIFFSLISNLFNKIINDKYLSYLISGILEFSKTSILLLSFKNKTFLDYFLINIIISFSSFSIIFQSYYYLINTKITIKKLLLSRVTICVLSSIIYLFLYLIFK